MGNFERAFAVVVGVEAGYVNDPNDPGGETKFGISKRTYPNVDIVNLTLDGAKAIYLSDFWNAISGDALPWPFALLVFDCAVNQGQGIARMLMQTALGVPSDGKIGPMTLAAAQRSTLDQWSAFMTLRRHRYELSANYPRYGDGWTNRMFKVCLQNAQGA